MQLVSYIFYFKQSLYIFFNEFQCMPMGQHAMYVGFALNINLGFSFSEVLNRELIFKAKCLLWRMKVVLLRLAMVALTPLPLFYHSHFTAYPTFSALFQNLIQATTDKRREYRALYFDASMAFTSWHLQSALQIRSAYA